MFIKIDDQTINTANITYIQEGCPRYQYNPTTRENEQVGTKTRIYFNVPQKDGDDPQGPDYIELFEEETSRFFHALEKVGLYVA